MHTRNHTCESDNSELFTRQLSTFLFFTEFSLSCENIARLHQFFLLCWCWYIMLLSFGKNQCWHRDFIKGYRQLIGCGLICGTRTKTIFWTPVFGKKIYKKPAILKHFFWCLFLRFFISGFWSLLATKLWKYKNIT